MHTPKPSCKLEDMFLHLGHRSVFDVTKGKSHYGSGGSYNHFAGRFVFFFFLCVNYVWRDFSHSFLLSPCIKS